MAPSTRSKASFPSSSRSQNTVKKSNTSAKKKPAVKKRKKNQPKAKIISSRSKIYNKNTLVQLRRIARARGVLIDDCKSKLEVVERLEKDDRERCPYLDHTNDILYKLAKQRGLGASLYSTTKRQVLIDTLMTADMNPKFHHFMELPAELRTMIYAFALHQDSPLLQPKPPAIALASKQLRRESLCAFYKTNQFTLVVCSPVSPEGNSNKPRKLGPRSAAWLKKIGDTNLGDIATLDLLIMNPSSALIRDQLELRIVLGSAPLPSALSRIPNAGPTGPLPLQVGVDFSARLAFVPNATPRLSSGIQALRCAIAHSIRTHAATISARNAQDKVTLSFKALKMAVRDIKRDVGDTVIDPGYLDADGRCGRIGCLGH